MSKLIVLLICIPFFLIGQNYTINAVHDNKLIIGIDNQLVIEGYTRNDSLHIQTSPEIKGRKGGRHMFLLTASQPKKDLFIILKNREEVIDTILVSSERTTLKQFIKTNKYGLIKSGEHSLELIQGIRSIELRTNIPGTEELRVLVYDIEIYNGNDILLSKTMKGKSLNHPEIINALNRLKRDGVVAIKRIKARTPWDDGKRPQNVFLKVK